MTVQESYIVEPLGHAHIMFKSSNMVANDAKKNRGELECGSFIMSASVRGHNISNKFEIML